MLYPLLKLLISAVVLVAISELAKRSTAAGALLASLPLVSLIAFIWLYVDTGDTQKVAALSYGIFWLVLPSLILFIALPQLLRAGWGFWASLAGAVLATVAGYFLMLWLLKKFGVAL
jgi:succinate-acetate transporter protein